MQLGCQVNRINHRLKFLISFFSSRFHRHLVMSKDKKPLDPMPPKPTREKIKYQVRKKSDTRDGFYISPAMIVTDLIVELSNRNKIKIREKLSDQQANTWAQVSLELNVSDFL